MKDKLWFFASYQYQSDAYYPGGGRPSAHRAKAHRVFGKLNWQISPKHKLAVALPQRQLRQPGTLRRQPWPPRPSA